MQPQRTNMWMQLLHAKILWYTIQHSTVFWGWSLGVRVSTERASRTSSLLFAMLGDRTHGTVSMPNDDGRENHTARVEKHSTPIDAYQGKMQR